MPFVRNCEQSSLASRFALGGRSSGTEIRRSNDPFSARSSHVAGSIISATSAWASFAACSFSARNSWWVHTVPRPANVFCRAKTSALIFCQSTLLSDLPSTLLIAQGCESKPRNAYQDCELVEYLRNLHFLTIRRHFSPDLSIFRDDPPSSVQVILPRRRRYSWDHWRISRSTFYWSIISDKSRKWICQPLVRIQYCSAPAATRDDDNQPACFRRWSRRSRSSRRRTMGSCTKKNLVHNKL